jgi:hypothetical protein
MAYMLRGGKWPTCLGEAYKWFTCIGGGGLGMW